MARPSATPGAGNDAQPITPTDPVVGRIDAAATDLHQALDAWIEHLRARGCSANTRKAYRAELNAAAVAMGWSSSADVTYDAVLACLARRQAERSWAPSTYNRNLACFRSFARYLEASGRAAKDPLRMAAGRRSAGERGARAATLEEARALIEHASARQARDQRCSGDRALYWLLLFACGMRIGEPALLRWRHVRLEGPVPHIAWEESLQKNGRRQNVVIAPEPAELLRAHRAAVPCGPDDLVFPIAPSRVTFRRDRAAIGVEGVDDRGYRFSPHTGRKTYSGWLLAGNVHERMIRFLMRHACDASQRYTDPSLTEQAAALAHIPRLWPFPQNVDNSRTQVEDLTSRRTAGSVCANATPSTDTNDSSTPPGFDPLDGVASAPRSSKPGGVDESVTGGAGAGKTAAASLEESGFISPTMPIVGSINLARTSKLGTLLVILGELLREEASHGSTDQAG